MEFNKKLGMKLKLLRIRKGISQKTFSDTLGLTANYVSMVEKGKKSPSVETFIDWCKQLEICHLAVLREL